MGREIGDRPDEDGEWRIGHVGGTVPGELQWDKPLADWIRATGVDLLGNEFRGNDAGRLESSDGWVID
jgi:hypothetical protein